MPRSTLLLFVVIAALSAALLLAAGVQPGEILRFAAYEAAFILLPGWLALNAFYPWRGDLIQQIGLGWAVGYVLEVLAFILTAALDMRPAFLAYPAIVAALTLPVIRAHHHAGGQRSAAGESEGARESRGSGAALALLYALAILYLGIEYFTTQPLPGTTPVTYYHDLVKNISIAAEAAHHWPMTDPRVAGEPMAYYVFVYLHMAAIHQVTGLPLALIELRLYIVPVVGVLILLLYSLGVQVSTDRRAGPAAVALTLFVGELDPSALIAPPYQFPFLHTFFDALWQSSTFIVGLVCFLALLLILHDTIITQRTRLRWSGGLLILLLLIGSGGTKGSILPVLGGGLGLYGVWLLWQRRVGAIHESPLQQIPLIGVLAMTAAVWGYFMLFVYGESDIAWSFAPLVTIRKMQVIAWAEDRIGGGPLFLAAATPIGMAGMMGARWAGMIHLLASPRRDITRAKAAAFLFALFAISLIPFFLLDVDGNSQLYFFWYGYVAACVLGAWGLVRFWQGRPRRRLRALVIGLLVLGALDTPLDNYYNVRKGLNGLPMYSDSPAGLTADLLHGLEWGRDHLPTGAILAVNNQYLASTEDERYFYYSAFLERRIFLEGWRYTTSGRQEVGFPDREALNRRVFEQGDTAAIAEMARRYGVTHLLVDRVHGDPAPDWGRAAHLIYRNDDVEIYKIGG